jgi:hypothetical protein
MYYGEEVPEYLDHINGDKTDNRISNLRVASHAQNLQNMPTYKSNTSGIKGVYWRNADKKWAAQINTNGQRLFLGMYEAKADAVRAIKEARERLHREFAHH